MSRAPTPVPFPYPPEENQRLLIQSVLLDGKQARASFDQWRLNTDFEDLPYKEFRWLAELGRAIERLAPDWENAPRVKAMQKYCWSHGIHILSTAKPALAALADAGIDVIALKGGGQIANDANAMHYRTINDIDLMVPTSAVPLASELLINAGWRPVSGRLPGRYRAQAFDKRNNSRAEGPHKVEIDLHHRVVHFGRYGNFDVDMFQRARPGNLLGVAVLVPSPLDQALIAISQALTPGPGDTNVWIGDIVRAVNDPAFEKDVFHQEIRKRRMVPHAACVMSWVHDNFGTSKDLIPTEKHSIARRVFVRELKTIGAERTDRNMIDIAAMGLAEWIRSGAVNRKVNFETDMGVAMTPLKAPPESIRLTGGPKQSNEIEKVGADGCVVRIGLPRDIKRSRDFDVWLQDRWVQRLRIRRIRKERLTYWTAPVHIGCEFDVEDVKLTESE